MNPGRWQTQWRLMLAVNAAVVAGVLLHKVTLPPWIPYIHLLVDYHFGFIKRALIGAAVGMFVDKVPVWLVFMIGGAVWLLTLAIFLRVFRRTFGGDAAQAPLVVFIAGSPFFFKNFMYTLGHFDIYGCLAVLVVMLLPAGSAMIPVAAAILATLLVLVHHIHLLMYVPTLFAIVIARYYLVAQPTRLALAAGACAVLGVGMLALLAQFYGTMPVPQEVFTGYLRSRMVDPSRNDLLQFAYVWYQPLAKEFHDTWERLPFNLLGVPVYALLIALHGPVWRYFAAVLAVVDPRPRRIMIAALIVISLGYVVMFATVFDYSRWISNWAVCMFLMLIAVKGLAAERAAPAIPADDPKCGLLGWIVTLIPRVGVVRPF